ncbi:MAG: class I SAM-dependent methyltransferase [Chloroflexi bacterium]|nr:class I SAM-dependent methyltransferase [Chloroflexota bacterium]
MYQVIELSLADLPRLYRYHQQELYNVRFSLKGFDYPWLLTAREWKRGERVLDVGAAYSTLPVYFHQNFGCEMWAADDFGMTSQEQFWERSGSPREFIESQPDVKYVLERLGDPANSSLPEGTFDVIYSLSVLEHIPGASLPAVWRHMDRLLKPGGELLHAVDIHFPSNGGLGKTLVAMAFDLIYPLLPSPLAAAKSQGTPKAFARLAFRNLGLRYRFGSDLSVLNLALNPEVLAESYHYGLKRMEKDGWKDFRYQRLGSLLIHLKKAA